MSLSEAFADEHATTAGRLPCPPSLTDMAEFDDVDPAAAQAIAVGANSACAPTINLVSTSDEAPSSSWMPLARPQPATSATTAAAAAATTVTRLTRPPILKPPEIQCCIDGAHC